MTNQDPIEPKGPGRDFDEIYHEIGAAIRDAKSLANLLTAVDQDECSVNETSFAQEWVLERAEEILRQILKFHPGHPGS